MMNKVRLLISGRVQGVYFRVFTRKRALQLGVKGYTRNMADGQVEVVAEAEEHTLEKFIQWCHKGPITARVEQVTLETIETNEVFSSFEIR